MGSLQVKVLIFIALRCKIFLALGDCPALASGLSFPERSCRRCLTFG
jgi:hypothetical protein